MAYPFTPDATGNIAVPETSSLLMQARWLGKQTVIRDGKLYDRISHSYTFSGKQELDVTWLFDFEDLPEAFKNYITIRAANVFAGRSVGSQEAVTFGQREETVARATLLEYDTQQGNYTIFSDRNGGDRLSTDRSPSLPNCLSILMAAISQVIPNLLGGVSQQPDPLKLPGQVREAENVLLDPTFGCRKRPPTQFIAKISMMSPPLPSGSTSSETTMSAMSSLSTAKQTPPDPCLGS